MAGGVSCWGDLLSANITSGSYTQLTVSDYDVCALGADDGRVTCWKNAVFDFAHGGPYVDVTTSSGCFLSAAGKVYCRAGATFESTTARPFVEYAAGYRSFGCGLRSDGTAQCQGTNLPTPDGTFKHLAVGINHACGIRTDGTIQCWGMDVNGSTRPPMGTFVAIAAGRDVTCAIDSDKALRCWGTGTSGETMPPMGRFERLAMSYASGCAIAEDKSLTCWGAKDSLASPLPTGQFVDVVPGCALGVDGAVSCWGYPRPQIPTPTRGAPFVKIGSGCALRSDGTVFCWDSEVGISPAYDGARPPF
jgi:alpha-tubulin suppressor-like RCC1 family protein